MTIRTLKPLLFVIILACGTGCTTGYWIDRGRDAADIFTVAAGYGVGVQGRVGYLVPGIGYHGGVVGLEGGEFFWGYKPKAGYASIFMLGIHETTNGGRLKKRNKNYSLISFWGFLMAGESGSKDTWPLATQFEITVGLGPSVRLGFNPGELVDFLLGWFNFDPAADDLERRKIEKENSG